MYWFQINPNENCSPASSWLWSHHRIWKVLFQCCPYLICIGLWKKRLICTELQNCHPAFMVFDQIWHVLAFSQYLTVLVWSFPYLLYISFINGGLIIHGLWRQCSFPIRNMLLWNKDFFSFLRIHHGIYNPWTMITVSSDITTPLTSNCSTNQTQIYHNKCTWEFYFCCFLVNGMIFFNQYEWSIFWSWFMSIYLINQVLINATYI